MSPREGRTVLCHVDLDCSRKRAWRAWSDADHASAWLAAEVKGRAVEDGEVKWAWRRPAEHVTQSVRASTPERRLLFECIKVERPETDDPWAPRGLSDAVGLRLEVRIEGDEKRCRVSIANSGFGDTADTDERVRAAACAWQLALERLRIYTENQWGMKRQGFSMYEPSNHSKDELLRRFRTQDGLASWLTERGEIGDSGSVLDLRLRHGATLRGDVLAATSRGVSLHLAERNAVLEFTAHDDINGRVLARIAYMTWSTGDAKLTAFEMGMSRAMKLLD